MRNELMLELHRRISGDRIQESKPCQTELPNETTSQNPEEDLLGTVSVSCCRMRASVLSNSETAAADETAKQPEQVSEELLPSAAEKEREIAVIEKSSTRKPEA